MPPPAPPGLTLRGANVLVLTDHELVPPTARYASVDVHTEGAFVSSLEPRGRGGDPPSAPPPLSALPPPPSTDSSASTDPPSPPARRVIDCVGMTLMTGLVDSHVHVTASSANLRMPSAMPASLLYARTVPILDAMLDRGFTTVRDCGGADHGLAAALDERTLRGPHVVFCGKALSQTGGHGDFRRAGDASLPSGACECCNRTIGRVCDGADACRVAVRDEARKGAGFIKIMTSGGVASPTDRLEQLQFSEEELRIICEEARNAGVYCAAHAYTDEAVRRAIECGAVSIEHGNFASERTLTFLRDEANEGRGGYLVPTLVTYDRLRRDGVGNGMAPELVAKVGDLVERGQETLRTAHALGVKVCYGSDLLGDMHAHQAGSIGLHLDAGVDPASVLLSLTATPARMMREGGPRPPGGPRDWYAGGPPSRDEGRVPPLAVAANQRADLIVVDGDVIRDPRVLMDERNVKLVVKAGEVVKCALYV